MQIEVTFFSGLFPRLRPCPLYGLPCLGWIAQRVFFIVFPVQLEEKRKQQRTPSGLGPLRFSGCGSAMPCEMNVSDRWMVAGYLVTNKETKPP